MVIELVNLKDKLQKEKKDPKYRLLKIDTIDKKLRCLRTAAKSFTVDSHPCHISKSCSLRFVKGFQSECACLGFFRAHAW
jgi:hypothetical protein